MELSSTAFLLIIAGYVLAGILSLVMAGTGLGGTSIGSRLLNGAIGVACLGYAGYLFFSTSESVMVFWYAMLLPFILAAKAFQNRRQAATEPVQPTPAA